MSRRWPWRRPEPDTAGLDAARKELAKAMGPDEARVASVYEAHHRKQANNHFGEQFARALLGGHR